MPELPEVENVRLSLQACVGLQIKDVFYSGKKMKNTLDINSLKSTMGCTINSITRRAKYLIFNLSTDKYFVIHLAISVVLRLSMEKSKKLLKHDHVALYFSNGWQLYFNDPRRFGMFAPCSGHQIAALEFLNKLAPDAIEDDFNFEYFKNATYKLKTSIKNCLLKQDIVAGIGNIYASEALFRAKISPLLPAQDLSNGQLVNLIDSIKSILLLAIKNGGSTLRDYKHIDGKSGGFQNFFSVYNQNGKSCANNCGFLIVKINQNNRSTFYCPHCQS